MRSKLLVSGLCGCAAAAPAVALAAQPEDSTQVGHGQTASPLEGAMRAEAAFELRRAARRQLAARRARERRAAARRRARAGGSSDTGRGAPAVLQAIAQCESGGDPTAVSGPYGGKYQFDAATWASVGGSGNPADAPASEQDMRAAMLYAREGTTPWPVCGRGR